MRILHWHFRGRKKIDNSNTNNSNSTNKETVNSNNTNEEIVISETSKTDISNEVMEAMAKKNKEEEKEMENITISEDKKEKKQKKQGQEEEKGEEIELYEDPVEGILHTISSLQPKDHEEGAIRRKEVNKSKKERKNTRSDNNKDKNADDKMGEDIHVEEQEEYGNPLNTNRLLSLRNIRTGIAKRMADLFENNV